MNDAAEAPGQGMPQEDAWRCAVRHLLLGAPCLLPAVSAAGAALGGQGWALPFVSLVVSYLLGMWRLLLMCLVCSALVLLHTTVQEEQVRNMSALLAKDGHAVVEGTVVRTLARGCVVDGGWNKPAVLLRGEIPYRCGDVVRVVGTPHESREPLCPGMFDAAKWKRGMGVAAELDYVRGELLGHPFSWAAVRGIALDIRAVLERNLLPEGTESDPRRQLLCALVLGDKQYADAGLMLNFQRGGCLHVFAVSGLHVGLVAGALWLLARLLNLRPSWSRYVVVVLVGVYALVTGLAVPALRAYLMLALVLGGTILKRRVSLLNIWCFVGLCILLVEPWQIRQSGFLLSFSVYAAICLGMRLCMQDNPWFGPDAYIPYRIMTRGEQRCKSFERWVRGIAIVAVSAWLASLPLCMALFHSFNLYSIFVNIAITPILPLVMTAGLLCLCFGWVPVLGALLGKLATLTAGWLLAVVSFFAALPCAQMPAQEARPAQEAIAVSLGYGNSACQLGNPGLLIDCGNAVSASFTLQPLLFHMGFTPAALVVTRPLDSRNGGAQVMNTCWPRMECLQAGKTDEMRTLRMPSGVFHIYYPPSDLVLRPAANCCPVITWHSPKGLVVYVGDASLATLERVEEDLSAARILILGHNKGQPVDADNIKTRMPRVSVLLLPGAAESGAQVKELAPMEVRSMEDETSFRLLDSD